MFLCLDWGQIIIVIIVILLRRNAAGVTTRTPNSAVILGLA